MTAKVPRRPLAWGMHEWGPLPGSAGTIQWDGTLGGAASRLYFYLATEHNPAGSRHAIEHPAANGTYTTVKAADTAVQAFVALASEPAEGDDR